MNTKRFLLHDPELDGDKLSCRRCAKRLSVDPDKSRDLYEAMKLLDDQACAEASLNQEGIPTPIS